MDDILVEILTEIKNLSVQHAETKTLLEAHIACDKDQDKQIEEIQSNVKDVKTHGTIIKGMLWVYGIIVSLLISKEIGKFIS